MSVSLNTPSTSLNGCWNLNCTNLATNAKNKCSNCRSAMYCGQACQKADWKSHKIICMSAKAKTDASKEQFPRLPTVNLADLLKTLDISQESISSLSSPKKSILSSQSKEPITDFSNEDLAVLGYSRKEIEEINKRFSKSKWNGNTLSKQTLSCFDYTLLTAGDRAVREQLFAPIGSQSVKEAMEERLPRWGYEIAESPEKGDLVLYSNETDITHMALYLGDGKAESKFGNDYPYTTIHSINEAYHRYGSHVAYYHKNPHSTPSYKEDHVIKFKYQTTK